MKETISRDMISVFLNDKEYDKLCHQYSFTRPLMRKLISDDNLYPMIESWFKESVANKYYKLLSVKWGNLTLEEKHYSPKEMLREFSRLLFIGKARARYKKLQQIVSYETLKKIYGNQQYCLKVKEKIIAIPTKMFFLLLEADEKEYQKFLKVNNKEDLERKRLFIFGLVKFFKEKDLLSKFEVDSKIVDRIENELAQGKTFDIEALKEFYEQKESYANVQLNEELKKYILREVPENLTLIEKAIYVYIRLCQCLSYDEKYFLNNLNGTENDSKRDIERLKKVNLSNNEVVCYEFSAIYAKFLEDLGLEVYTTGANYGAGHNSVVFSDGNYVLHADSVKSIFNADLYRAKMGLPLNGLFCSNNEDFKRNFRIILNEVYESTRDYRFDIASFNDCLLKQEFGTREFSSVAFSNKLPAFFSILESCKLEKMDRIMYIHHLMNELFSRKELRDNIRVRYLKNDSLIGEKAMIIFMVKNNDVTEYYQLRNAKVEKLNNEEVIELMKEGKLTFYKKRYRI